MSETFESHNGGFRIADGGYREVRQGIVYRRGRATDYRCPNCGLLHPLVPEDWDEARGCYAGKDCPGGRARGRRGWTGYVHEFTAGEREAGHARRLGIAVAELRERLGAGEKWCAGCKAWHRRDEFGPNASAGDGLSPQCRDWRRAYQRRQRAA